MLEIRIYGEMGTGKTCVAHVIKKKLKKLGFDVELDMDEVEDIKYLKRFYKKGLKSLVHHKLKKYRKVKIQTIQLRKPLVNIGVTYVKSSR